MSQPGPRVDDRDERDGSDAGGSPDTRMVGTPVVVRRNAGLDALVGAGASAVAIAYLWRASTWDASLDWVTCLLMALVAVFYLTHLVDARTPLLVADDLGVRIRLGNHWRGLPWDAVGSVVVRPRRGLLRDGQLVFAPHSTARALDGLDARGRRAAGLNQKLYGAPLAVPMGLTTRVSARGRALTEELAALAAGRADIVEASRSAAADPVEASRSAEPDESAEAPATRRSILGGLGTVVSRVAKGRSHDLDSKRVVETSERPAPPDEAVALRAERRGLRAQVSRESPAAGLGSVALLLDPEDADVRRRPELDQENVRPISTLGDPVGTLVVDDFVIEPADDPVIGPELAAARTRVGLSVDELAERTRIRPHVIESIEVDDFAPCGGDFYARGHLRTLARVLGRDPVRLVEQFDHRYATAPVNARRVFEAEMATGMTSTTRRRVNGPNWVLLVGVVLVLVLTWAVVRLFAAEPPQELRSPVPTLNGSAGLGQRQEAGAGAASVASRPLTLTLLGSQDGSQVVVRDRTGKVVWAGELAPGERRSVQAPPPVTVRAEDGGAVAASVNGQARGLLGQPGEPGSRVFPGPTAR